METSANRDFERTDANGCERSLAFAMQKVEGSSPFIRSQETPAKAGFLTREDVQAHDVHAEAEA